MGNGLLSILSSPPKKGRIHLRRRIICVRRVIILVAFRKTTWAGIKLTLGEYVSAKEAERDNSGIPRTGGKTFERRRT